MYALENVINFVNDKNEFHGASGPEILSQAEELSEDGVITGGAVERIFNNQLLLEQFDAYVMNNPEQLEIAVSAVNKQIKAS